VFGRTATPPTGREPREKAWRHGIAVLGLRKKRHFCGPFDRSRCTSRPLLWAHYFTWSWGGAHHIPLQSQPPLSHVLLPSPTGRGWLVTGSRIFWPPRAHSTLGRDSLRLRCHSA
jgi:hypothetical protein